MENQVRYLEMMWERQEKEREVLNFISVHEKLKAGKNNVENELNSMGITTIKRLFCFAYYPMTTYQS